MRRMRFKVKLSIVTTMLALASLLVYAGGYDEFVHPAQIDSNDFKGLTDGVESNAKGNQDLKDGLQYNDTPKSQDELNQKFNSQGASTPNIDQTQYENMNDSERESYGKQQSGALQNQYKNYKNDYNNSAHSNGTDAELVWYVTSKERQIEANDTDLSVDNFNKLYNDINNNQSEVQALSVHHDLNANSTTDANFSQSIGSMEMVSQMLDSTRSARDAQANRAIWCAASEVHTFTQRIVPQSPNEDSFNDNVLPNHNKIMHASWYFPEKYKLHIVLAGSVHMFIPTITTTTLINKDVYNNKYNVTYSGWQTKDIHGVQKAYDVNTNPYNIPQELLDLCLGKNVKVGVSIAGSGSGYTNAMAYEWHDYQGKPSAVFDNVTINGHRFRIDNGKEVIYAPDLTQLLNQTLDTVNNMGANIHIFKGTERTCRYDFHNEAAGYSLVWYATNKPSLCEDGDKYGVSSGVAKPYVCSLDNERYKSANCGGNCDKDSGGQCQFKPDFSGGTIKAGGAGSRASEDEKYIMSIFQAHEQNHLLTYMYSEDIKKNNWNGVTAGCTHNRVMNNCHTVTIYREKHYCAFSSELQKLLMDVLVDSPNQHLSISHGGVKAKCGGIGLEDFQKVNWDDPNISNDIKQYVSDMQSDMNLDKIEQKVQSKVTTNINQSTNELINNASQIQQKYGNP